MITLGFSDATYEFDTLELSIGRARNNDLVIRNNHLGRRHVRVVVRPEGTFVSDLGSTNGTNYRGSKIQGTVLLPEGGAIQIADSTVAIGTIPEQTSPLDETEQQFFKLLAGPDADDDRLVYIDWLEEHGLADRAAYLRLHLQPVSIQTNAQMATLAPSLPRSWCAIVTRPMISGCTYATGACPKRWDRLTRTSADTIRRCTTCNATVHYCASKIDASRYGSRYRVVLDPSESSVILGGE